MAVVEKKIGGAGQWVSVHVIWGTAPGVGIGQRKVLVWEARLLTGWISCVKLELES